MARLCSICSNRMVDSINLEIVEHAHGFRAIARQYGVTRAALQRHANAHLRDMIHQSKELTAMLRSRTLLARLDELDRHTDALLARALAGDDLRGALAAIREARELVLAYAKVSPIQRTETFAWELERERQSTAAAFWREPSRQSSQHLKHPPHPEQHPADPTDADFDALFDVPGLEFDALVDEPDLPKRKQDDHEGQEDHATDA